MQPHGGVEPQPFLLSTNLDAKRLSCSAEGGAAPAAMVEAAAQHQHEPSSAAAPTPAANGTSAVSGAAHICTSCPHPIHLTIR